MLRLVLFVLYGIASFSMPSQTDGGSGWDPLGRGSSQTDGGGGWDPLG